MDYRWRTTGFADFELRELYAVLRLRQEVFVVEQACLYLDADGLDLPAVHILCWQGDTLAAYQRCLPPGTCYPESALGRILVNAGHRGRGLGRELVRRGVAHNLGRWPGRDILINAQSYLRRFYTELGFAAEGGEYDDKGVPHLRMRLRASGDL